jgi:hypothetical protein|tara:strand:- start:98 stop:640 length:543 start_codon:yes stop_codon:yes gene_type:complete
MKPVVIDNIISQKELCYMYNQIVSSQGWNLVGQSTVEDNTQLMASPLLKVKDSDGSVHHYPFLLWGQSLIYRLAELLNSKKIGIPTNVDRMWLNVTYHGKKTQHWFHADDENNFNTKSILLFMTPIWQPDWKGSFYIDGEEFKFRPGSAVIFDSKEYHKGESPGSELHNWQRLTCNILVR